MYVCVCHALTDVDVRAAEAEGAATNAEVFRHFGVRPQCGRCVPSMRGMLGCQNLSCERRHASDAADQPRNARREDR